MNIRIGNGFDVHRFADAPIPDSVVTLGGIRISHERPLLAHSDGDVVIHSLCDGMLGALALGDIGKHFPDSDPAYRDIDSAELLRHVYRLVSSQGWRLVNADLTIIAERPRIAPHIHAMRENLANLLQVTLFEISVKATTTEGLGFAGRREGIACQCSLLLGDAPHGA